MEIYFVSNSYHFSILISTIHQFILNFVHFKFPKTSIILFLNLHYQFQYHKFYHQPDYFQTANIKTDLKTIHQSYYFSDHLLKNN